MCRRISVGQKRSASNSRFQSILACLVVGSWSHVFSRSSGSTEGFRGKQGHATCTGGNRVPGETSKLEIKLRSGERAEVGERVLDTLVGMAEKLCWLCVLFQRMCGSLTDINCSRHRKNS